MHPTNPALIAWSDDEPNVKSDLFFKSNKSIYPSIFSVVKGYKALKPYSVWFF